MMRLSTDSRAVCAVLLLWAVAAAMHFTLGHACIAALYKGTFPVEAAERLLQGRGEHPLAHYLDYADRRFRAVSPGVAGTLLASVFVWLHVLPSLLRRGRAATRRLPLSALLGFVLLAWAARFIQDDAFISFRYAERLVEGRGLTWNDGYRVEGYTNFLWTLLMAGGIRLGLDPVAGATLLGISCFLGSLWLTHWLCLAALGDPPLALLAVLLCAGNYSFLAYATGGLETQMQCFLCLACMCLAVLSVEKGQARVLPAAALSLTAAAAVLTRLDSVVLILPPCLYAAVRMTRGPAPFPAKARTLFALLLPGAAIVGAWLIWKLTYYGGILPNTFFAKVGTGAAMGRGLKYCFLFVREYFLFPHGLLLVAEAPALCSDKRPWIRPAAVAALLWTGYVVAVGGDFMEFRFFVPVLPIVAMLLAWLIGAPRRTAPVRLALVAILLLASAVHALRFRGAEGGVESVARLQGRMTFNKVGWPGIGRALKHTFGAATGEVVIATTACGAIPFYSGLECIDMHGLNDRWVARHGRVIGGRPGHQRMATLDYLLRRGVHLVVGHPHVREKSAGTDNATPDAAAAAYFQQVFAGEPLPAEARILDVPVGEDLTVSALYITRSPTVDRAIARREVVPHPVSRNQPGELGRRRGCGLSIPGSASASASVSILPPMPIALPLPGICVQRRSSVKDSREAKGES